MALHYSTTVEPLYNDTIGNQQFVRYSDVSLTQRASGIFPVGMALRHPAVRTIGTSKTVHYME